MFVTFGRTAVAAADEPADPAAVPNLPPALAAASTAVCPGAAARRRIVDRVTRGGDLFALTVDDGASSEVVRLYTQFAKDTGIRLTYFVNGQYNSWTENAGLLRPLVESGQIQLGNHTYSHPDLTSVSKQQIADELTKNGTFLRNTYGVDAAPYFRPPYGGTTRQSIPWPRASGYTVPTLWYGSLSDSSLITEEYILQMANQYFNPGAIVIGHLNYLPVTHVYPQLVDIIRSRNLRTVTLNDVYLKP